MKASAVILSLLLLGTGLSLAQTGTPSSVSTSTSVSGIKLRAVAGAPFSADVARLETRLMPDGTSSQLALHGKVFRDGQGRTRYESEQASITGVTRHLVTIVDPVQQVSMVLNVEGRTAVVFAISAPKSVSAKNLKFLARAEKAAQPVKGMEDLGAMTIEGFAVTGARRTVPAAAGATRDKTTSALTETWFSPELKVEMLALTQSPQMTCTTQLAHVSPGEPDPALFQIPADYAVRADPAQKQVAQ